MTRHETDWMRIVRSIGSSAPKSASRTVAPMMQTLAPARSSVSVKLRPCSMARLVAAR